MDIETENRLVHLCLDEACRSRECVEKWRRQRRSLERMPSHLADSLLRRLNQRRLLFPSLLEVFKNTVEEVNLQGENCVDAEWMAYLGAFRYLRILNLAGCHKITSSALWSITGMSCLKEVNLSRCLKVTDAGIRHLLSIPTLEKLSISETGLTADGVTLLSSLKNLSFLDLGGLPVTDMALNSLQVLAKLQYLDLWGSKISDKGAAVLHQFPKLSFLNLAWTNVTKLTNISSLEFLDLSNCTINSLLEGDSDKAPLLKLIFSGVTFTNETEAFLYIETSFLLFLDVSNSSFQNFSFLVHMKMLQHLDLSSTKMGDDSIELVACIGANLRNLNLNNTSISSAGVGIMVGHVPNLEILSLANTSVDDVAISYIRMMPSVKAINFSNTYITGFVHHERTEADLVPSLLLLQNLYHLDTLNLEQTKVTDSALHPLSNFKELIHLSLKSASLTDASLHHLSSLPKLTNLGIQDAVLTDHGLDSFRPGAELKMLDLRGCWLLSEGAISSFCKRFPQIEVRHELVRVSPSNQSSPYRPSSSRRSLKNKTGKKKQEEFPFLIDQRMKYSKEELLALQYSTLSLASAHEWQTRFQSISDILPCDIQDFQRQARVVID